MYLTRISKGFSYIVVLTVLQFVIGLAFYSIVAKVLTQSDLGIISTLTFIYVIFTTVTPLALPVAGTKYISEFIGRGDQEKAANVGSKIFKLVFELSTVLLVAFCVGAYFIVSSFYSASNVLVFIFITFVAAFIATIRIAFLAFLQGLQYFDRHAISGTFSIVVSRLTSLLLIVLGNGLTGFALGILVGETSGLALTFFFYHGSLPKPKEEYDSRLLFRFSLPIYMMTIVTVLLEWIDRMLFLAVSSDLEALGVYELAIRAVGVLTIIWSIVDVFVLPVFSENYGKMGEASLPPLLKKAIRYLAFMFFPAALGLSSISERMMVLLFSTSYAEGALPLAILSISAIFIAFSTVLGSTLKSIGETRVFVKIAILSIIVDSLLVVTFAPRYGILGALIGKVASVVISFFYVYRELKSKIRLEIDKEGVIKGFFASVLLVVVLRLFEVFYAKSSTPFLLVAEIGLGIICYFLGLTLLKALRKEDFQLLRQIAPKSFSGIISLFERILVH